MEAGIRRGVSVNPFSMAWLREIFWVAAMFNIELIPVRVSSEENILADALSRLNTMDSKIICGYNLSEFESCCLQAVMT